MNERGVPETLPNHLGFFDEFHIGYAPCGCAGNGSTLCFKHKLKSIQFGGKPPSPQSVMERQWERDMPAYYRLRMDGVQPREVKGSAELESRATSQQEIDMGVIIDKKLQPRVEEGLQAAKEMSWSPIDSAAESKKRRQS